MSRALRFTSPPFVLVALLAFGLPLSASEVAVPHSTPRIDGLDLELPIGQESVKLASKLGYDARGKIVGDATIDGAAATVLGKLSKRKGSFFISIVFRVVAEKVTMKVEGAVGAGTALISYTGPRGKVKRVATPVSLAATLGASPGTLEVVGSEDAKGKLIASGRFVSSLGNDPAGEGTLTGKIKKGTKISFRFKNERQKLSFKGVRQGDFFVGTLKLSSPPAKETFKGFSLSVGFLLRFNPTVAVTSLTSDRERAQIGASARLDWTLRGVPTTVTLDPAAQDVTAVLSTTAVPFAGPPAGVDPRTVFKVTARDLVTTTEVARFAGIQSLGGPGAGAVDRDAVAALATLPDGGIVVLGTFSGTVTFGTGGLNVRTLTAVGGTDMYLARLNADGTLGFVTQIRSAGGGDTPRAVTASADGAIVITGAVEGASSFDDPPSSATFSFPGGAGLDLFVAGYSREGGTLFAFAAPGASNESGTAVAAYLDGGFLVAGFSPQQGLGNEIGFARVIPGARGAEVESTFNGEAGGPGNDQPTAVATFPDGSAVIAGFFEETATFGDFVLTARGERDAFIARIDQGGAFTIAHQIGGRGDDAAFGVAAFPDGSAVVAGRFRGEAQASGATTDLAFTAAGGEADDDVFLIRYDSRGEITSGARAGGPAPDGGLGVAALGDGSVAVTGTFAGTARFGAGPEAVELVSAGGTDVFLARYNRRIALEQAVAAGGAGDDEGAATAAFADGSMLVAGRFAGAATFGFGEAGETAVTAQGLQDAFIARHEPVNYRFVEVRPEGLSFAKVPGTGENPNHVGSSIAAASDGSSWVAGSFQGELLLQEDLRDPGRRVLLVASGNQDAYVAHVLPDGTVNLARQIGAQGSSATGLGVAALPDGGAVVTGTFKGSATFAPGVTLTASGGSDMFLARYRADGSLVFAVRGGGAGVVGADSGTSVAVLADDEEIVVTGHADTGSALNFTGALVNISLAARNRAQDIFIARFTQDGEPLSVLLAGGPGDDRGAGVAIGADQSLWVTGQVDTAASTIALDEAGGGTVVVAPAALGIQGILAHYEEDGALRRANFFGGPASDAGAAVAATSDGGVLVTGSFSGEAVFGDPLDDSQTLISAGGRDIFVARFNFNDALVDVTGAGGPGDDDGLGIAALPDGSALVTGSFALDATFGEGDAQATLSVVDHPRVSLHTDIFLARYDLAGALVFARSAGGGGQDAGQSVAALPDGSALLAGVVGTGAAALRTGPPIVFGAGEANEASFDDLDASGIIITVVRSLFFARYFPYGTEP